jgi:hypothetical protein
MESFITQLAVRNLINPPLWVLPNLIYETIVGSHTLGIPSDTSDVDISSVCIPPLVFGQQACCYQNHSVQVEGQEYDLTVHNIEYYFRMFTASDPIMLWSLFTPSECVLYSTKAGDLMRESRNLFLHKGCWPAFMSYASTRWQVVLDGNPRAGSSREKRIRDHGYDTKGAYHAVLALGAIDHLLRTGDLEYGLNLDYLTAIRQGAIAAANVWDWMEDKAVDIDESYKVSELPDGPDSGAIQKLYTNCLEEHRGDRD